MQIYQQLEMKYILHEEYIENHKYVSKGVLLSAVVQTAQDNE
jgi:hypothetical protein